MGSSIELSTLGSVTSASNLHRSRAAYIPARVLVVPTLGASNASSIVTFPPNSLCEEQDESGISVVISRSAGGGRFARQGGGADSIVGGDFDAFAPNNDPFDVVESIKSDGDDNCGDYDNVSYGDSDGGDSHEDWGGVRVSSDSSPSPDRNDESTSPDRDDDSPDRDRDDDGGGGSSSCLVGMVRLPHRT